MLAQMRTMARGWIARIFLGVLALMLAVTLFSGDFLQGIQGMFNPNAVATVAGQSISPDELARDFDNWLETQRSTNEPVSRADAIAQQVHLRVLESIIGRRALHVYANRLGVHASNTQVAAEIRRIEAVQNPLSGNFDRQEYLDFLRRIKYSPGEFEREVRRDLSVRQFLSALTAGARPPSSFGKLALAFETERRVISVAEIAPGAAGAVPAPTDAQINELYQAMHDSLRIPEYRALTIVSAHPRDFVPRVTVTEEQIRAEFEARRARLETPARRSFVQISAPDEAQAREAAQRLARGEDAAAIARALNLQTVSYTEQTQAQLPDAAVGRAAFSMQLDASQAVQGALTPWAALRVTAVAEARAADYADHRDEIRAEIAEDEAVDVMNEAVSRFTDARSAGTGLAEAARANGMTTIEIPRVDAQGLDANGEPAAALIDQPEIIRAAFAAPEGEATDFIAAADGSDVIVEVNRIFEPSVRPLAEVRADLERIWTARERLRRLEAIAERIKEAVHSGRTFAAATQAEGAQMRVRSQEITRQLAARGALPPQLAGGVFNAREGDVVHGPRPDTGALMVAMVEEIRRDDPSEASGRVEAFRRQFDQALGRSLAETVEDAAIAAGSPNRNETLLRRIYAQDQPPQQ